MSKKVGTNNVATTAEKMGINRSRVVYLTANVLRKLRWPAHLKAIEEFIDEYSGQTTE